MHSRTFCARHKAPVPKMGLRRRLLLSGKDHLLGRLAATVAKQLLNGERVTVVQCEQICVSGSAHRNRMKFMFYLNKTTRSNPKWGPHHHRAPSRVFWKAVRGMLPHKTRRGAEALDKLKVYEGVPAPYDKMKRMVCPDAMRVLRLKPGRRFVRLADLCSSVGWKYASTIEKLEDKRKTRAHAWYQKRLARTTLHAKATAEADAGANDFLSSYGY